MKSGIVLEISKSKAVILKPDGTFEIIKANPIWRKGDIVNLPKKPYYKIVSVAASILVFLLVGFGGALYFTKEITISVDVNPSLELDVNRFGKIVSVRSYNKEAKQIIKQLSLKYKSYNEGLEKILSNESLGSYIEKNPYMLVTVQTKSKEEEAAILQYVKSIINTQVQLNHTGVEIDCIPVDKMIVEEAHHYGVSPGIYTLLLELQEIGGDINLEDYLNENLTQIREDIAHCHAAISAQENNSTEEIEKEYHHEHTQHKK